MQDRFKKPLENYRDIDAFKIYVSDLGLLCTKKDLAAQDVLYMADELNDFKGGMTENYVNVQLTINGYKTYYWQSERGAEVDFVIQCDRYLIPLRSKVRITQEPRALMSTWTLISQSMLSNFQLRTLDSRAVKR